MPACLLFAASRAFVLCQISREEVSAQTRAVVCRVRARLTTRCPSSAVSAGARVSCVTTGRSGARATSMRRRECALLRRRARTCDDTHDETAACLLRGCRLPRAARAARACKARADSAGTVTGAAVLPGIACPKRRASQPWRPDTTASAAGAFAAATRIARRARWRWCARLAGAPRRSTGRLAPAARTGLCGVRTSRCLRHAAAGSARPPRCCRAFLDAVPSAERRRAHPRQHHVIATSRRSELPRGTVDRAWWSQWSPLLSPRAPAPSARGCA